MNGKGYYNNGKIIYEIINGNGYIEEYSDYGGKLVFEGEFFNGEKNGKGKEYYYDGKSLKYEGEYLYGKRNGMGKEYYTDGKTLKFEGEYQDGKKIFGKGYDSNGKILYKLENKAGEGKEYNDKGKLIFEGGYLNGEKR